MVERLTRRKLLAATGSVVAAASIAGSTARADAPWPSKPIRVLMPFGAGGSMDILRLLARRSRRSGGRSARLPPPRLTRCAIFIKEGA
jgi:hypothetical protein